VLRGPSQSGHEPLPDNDYTGGTTLPNNAITDRPMWEPSPARIAGSNMVHFMYYASEITGREFASYAALYDWSISDIPAFWKLLWDYFGVIHARRCDRVLEGSDIMTARWFEGARLNFAQNLLLYTDSHPAIISQSEDTEPVSMTYHELYDSVARCVAAFRRLGLSQGDRVAGFVTNAPHAVISMLAATSLGAIWSSCSPDFGFQGVLDRFGQIKPKLFVTVDGYCYNGKKYDSMPTIEQVAASIPSIEKVIIIGNLGASAGVRPAGSIRWEELLAQETEEIDFVQLPFNHPVYIMYSSGTTGVPKCIVHGAGGTLLQHLKELALHTDLKRDDVITYYTTCGWMMWNWLVSSLAVGATIYLYDGSPSYPTQGRLFDAIDKEKISIFGTSPKFLSSCEREGLKPKEHCGLSSLRTILSTGSPLSRINFEYVYREIKANLQLASISGGTDIISCFLLGCPTVPVYPEELQCRGLGMKVEAADDAGKIVYNQVGELVCSAPFPSRPVMFWDDPDNAKYRAAYFEHFPGVWRHGDYIMINERGGAIIYGRSDATLNPGGVRIGTAEIYGPVESMDEIQDSLVAAQRVGDDVRIVLFVVTAEGISLTEKLKGMIRQRIREQKTPRHVPALILAVTDIPRTLNGKKVEMAVTKVIHGQEIVNKDALANPESLEQFSGFPELKTLS
jgi:acetoacetyl-CoA synthetase